MTKKYRTELLTGADNYYNLVHPVYYKEEKLMLLPINCTYAISESYHDQSDITQEDCNSTNGPRSSRS